MFFRVVCRCTSYNKVAANVASRNLSKYKSSLALDKIYPNSSLDLATPPKVPGGCPRTFSGFIPMEKIQITSSKSSGPGGQNVNTTNSKVDVRFKVSQADWIPEEIRSTMLVKEGYFIIQSDRTRSLHLNTADALEKLREFIRSCEPQEPSQPSEETLEKLRRQKEKATRERLRTKIERSSIKSSRGSVSFSDM